MSAKDDQNDLRYVERALAAFMEIRSHSHKGQHGLANIDRAHKGELFVLQFLAMRDGAVLPSELSAALHASTARISALLGALEKKGQIVRDIDKSNRRNILVTITQAGRSRVETEMHAIESRMAQVFIDMGEADTEEFIRLTRRFFELMHRHMQQE